MLIFIVYEYESVRVGVSGAARAVFGNTHYCNPSIAATFRKEHKQSGGVSFIN